MAYTSPVLLALLMVVATASVVHCQLNVGGVNVAQLTVFGTVKCQVTTPSLASPISGVPVSLTCNGGTTTLASAVTNPLGEVTLVVKALDSAVFDASRCVVAANLPAATCAVAAPTGVLTSALTFVNFIATNQGNVAKFVFSILG